ncbi:MAG: hypothetical protein WD512_11905 [Candidatus Paceibacterota bacterium]
MEESEYNALCDAYDSIVWLKEQIANEEYEDNISNLDEYTIKKIHEKIKTLKVDLDDYTRDYNIMLNNYTLSAKKNSQSIQIKDLGKLLYTHTKSENALSDLSYPLNVYYYNSMIEPREFNYVDFVGTASTHNDINSIIQSHPEMKKYGSYIEIYTNGILLLFGGCS